MTGVNFISAIRLESKCNASDSKDDSQRCCTFDSDETKIKSRRNNNNTTREQQVCATKRREALLCLCFFSFLSLSLPLSLGEELRQAEQSFFSLGSSSGDTKIELLIQDFLQQLLKFNYVLGIIVRYFHWVENICKCLN